VQSFSSEEIHSPLFIAYLTDFSNFEGFSKHIEIDSKDLQSVSKESVFRYTWRHITIYKPGGSSFR